MKIIDKTDDDIQFESYLKKSHAEVLRWPDWKQKLLGWNIKGLNDIFVNSRPQDISRENHHNGIPEDR